MHKTVVNCPTCGRSIEWSDGSPWRPFCSERCRLIDLGAWFSEGRSISGEEPGPHAEEVDDDD